MAIQTNARSDTLIPVGFLTLVFVILKLTNQITWSWLWVLSPLWISFLLFLVGLLFIAFVAISIAVFKGSSR